MSVLTNQVSKHGAIPHHEIGDDHDWKTVTEQASFIPRGKHKKDWE